MHLQQMMGVSLKDIHNLIDANLLHPIPHQTTLTVPGENVLNALKTTVIAPCIAKLRGRSLSVVRAELVTQGHELICGDNIFYRRNAAN